MKILLVILCLFISSISYEQGNFEYNIRKGVINNTVKIVYTPSDNNFYLPEAFVVKYKKNREFLFDVDLEKKGNKYYGYVTFDTSINLLVFSFKNAGIWDNNNDKGYFVYIKNGDSIKNYSYLNTAHYFDFYGPYKFGLKKNDSAAVANYEKEFELFPQNRDRFYISYLNDLKRYNKTTSNALAINEIEKLKKNIISTRQEYEKIQDLYSIIDSLDKVEIYKKLRIEKIPLDKYVIEDLRKILQLQKNVEVIEQMLKDFKFEANVKGGKGYLSKQIEIVSLHLFNIYLEDKNWKNLRNILDSIKPIALLYWKASQRAKLEINTIDDAKYFALQAVKISKNDYETPGEIPNYLTFKELIKENKTSYGFYLDYYASLLIESKLFNEAYTYSHEASLIIEEQNNIEYNSHYSTIISNIWPVKKYILDLEKFVREGKNDDNIYDLLKAAFLMINKDSASFNYYLSDLKQNGKLKLENTISKLILNYKAPIIYLKNLEGEEVNLAKYMGKTIILDFWATWCAPCLASFPSMNKLINQYKNDSNIIFFFVNTLQSENNKLKNVKDYLIKKNYQFNVLMDSEDKVVQTFKVNNLPAKVIIGKDGNIKFISIGYKGDAIFRKEFETMITLAN